MTCTHHPGREASVTCHGCGKPFCGDCVVAFEKLSLCADCKQRFLAGVDDRPSRPAAPRPPEVAATTPGLPAGAAPARRPAAVAEAPRGSLLPWAGGAVALVFALLFVFVIVGSLAKEYRDFAADRSLADAFANVAAVGSALERFHADTGRYPEKLTALVPKYLTSLPADPYGGALRYAATPSSGRRVWSIGPDGHDDHGQPPKDIALQVELPP